MGAAPPLNCSWWLQCIQIPPGLLLLSTFRQAGETRIDIPGISRTIRERAEGPVNWEPEGLKVEQAKGHSLMAGYIGIRSTSCHGMRECMQRIITDDI